MAYEPNWNDKRVINRTSKVLDWASQFLVGKQGSILPVELSSNGFTDSKNSYHPGMKSIFGPVGNKLGDYLRSKILKLNSNHYIPGKKNRSYFFDRNGFEFLCKKIKFNEHEKDELDPLYFLEKSHIHELKNLVFEYTDKSDRFWHPLQNISSNQKNIFWQRNGLPHNYDIVACAPTLLYQIAINHGLPEIVLNPIYNYLQNRNKLRKYIADLISIPLDLSKKLINSLFNGARLGCNNHLKSFSALNFNEEKMNTLKNDEQIKKLRRSISYMWKSIERLSRKENQLSFEQILNGDQTKNWRLSTSKSKWRIYFRFERMVLTSIKNFLNKSQIKYFTEHDGFRTSLPISTDELSDHVLKETGFRVKFEYEELSA